jgi:hypothetical protein
LPWTRYGRRGDVLEDRVILSGGILQMTLRHRQAALARRTLSPLVDGVCHHRMGGLQLLVEFLHAEGYIARGSRGCPCLIVASSRRRLSTRGSIAEGGESEI